MLGPIIGPLAVGKPLVRVVVVVQPQANLLQVILALHAIGGLADFLNRRKQ